MDALSTLLESLKKGGQTEGHFRGFLHVLIGRKITRHTDKTIVRIAVDRGISERTINRWRDRDGWARRSDRVRDVPPATRLLEETTALLVARSAAAAADATAGEKDAAPVPAAPSAIERIERLVEKELAAV